MHCRMSRASLWSHLHLHVSDVESYHKFFIDFGGVSIKEHSAIKFPGVFILLKRKAIPAGPTVGIDCEPRRIHGEGHADCIFGKMERRRILKDGGWQGAGASIRVFAGQPYADRDL